MSPDKANEAVQDLIKQHLAGESFSVVSLQLDAHSTSSWVRFRIDPKRFEPGIFEGDWAAVRDNPQPGPIRVLRVLTGLDGVARVIGRQGPHIFATPWM